MGEELDKIVTHMSRVKELLGPTVVLMLNERYPPLQIEEVLRTAVSITITEATKQRMK